MQAPPSFVESVIERVDKRVLGAVEALAITMSQTALVGFRLDVRVLTIETVI